MITFDKKGKLVTFSKKETTALVPYTNNKGSQKLNKLKEFGSNVGEAAKVVGTGIAIRVGAEGIKKGIKKLYDKFKSHAQKRKEAKAAKSAENKANTENRSKDNFSVTEDKNMIQHNCVNFSGFQKKYKEALESGNLALAKYLETRHKSAFAGRRQAQSKKSDELLMKHNPEGADTYTNRAKRAQYDTDKKINDWRKQEENQSDAINKAELNARKTNRYGKKSDIRVDKTVDAAKNVANKVKEGTLTAWDKTKNATKTGTNIARAILNKAKNDTVKATKSGVSGAKNLLDKFKALGSKMKAGMDNYVTDIKNEAAKYNKKK